MFRLRGLWRAKKTGKCRYCDKATTLPAPNARLALDYAPHFRLSYDSNANACDISANRTPSFETKVLRRVAELTHGRPEYLGDLQLLCRGEPAQCLSDHAVAHEAPAGIDRSL